MRGRPSRTHVRVFRHMLLNPSPAVWWWQAKAAVRKSSGISQQIRSKRDEARARFDENQPSQHAKAARIAAAAAAVVFSLLRYI